MFGTKSYQGRRGVCTDNLSPAVESGGGIISLSLTLSGYCLLLKGGILAGAQIEAAAKVLFGFGFEGPRSGPIILNRG